MMIDTSRGLLLKVTNPPTYASIGRLTNVRPTLLTKFTLLPTDANAG